MKIIGRASVAEPRKGIYTKVINIVNKPFNIIICGGILCFDS